MLPFLKKKEAPVAGLIIKTRTPDESNEPEANHSEGKLACARDLISAMKADDPQGVCDALEAYNEVSDMNEAEPHSYESQNQEAAD